MRVAVTGATGTIGRALVRELAGRGDEVTALSRDAERAAATLGVQARPWADPQAAPPPADALSGRDAVVNLLGENLAQRWTGAVKQELHDSRVLTTRNLVKTLGELTEDERPRTLVSASGIDVYGPRGDEPVHEGASAGDDFLAGLVADWEAEARRAEQLGVRVVLLRTAMVLSPAGGALAKMLPFFRLGVGGPVAGGRQYVPWIHLDDAVGIILFCLDTATAAGPINVTVPEPVTNRDFSRTLGRVLRRPAFWPVPALAVKALYGEMATIVTTGQRALPGRLTELGYSFRYPELEGALRATTQRPASRSSSST
jgi:uncharacterized protein (TIGR01777 family)